MTSCRAQPSNSAGSSGLCFACTATSAAADPDMTPRRSKIDAPESSNPPVGEWEAGGRSGGDVVPCLRNPPGTELEPYRLHHDRLSAHRTVSRDTRHFGLVCHTTRRHRLRTTGILASTAAGWIPRQTGGRGNNGTFQKCRAKPNRPVLLLADHVVRADLISPSPTCRSPGRTTCSGPAPRFLEAHSARRHR